MARDTSRDGVGNKLQSFALTHCGSFWWLIQRSDRLARWVNKWLVNRSIYTIPTRPYQYSLMTLDPTIPGPPPRSRKADKPYTSWDSLIDRTYTGRHLPPDPEFNARLPDIADVADLFRRRNGVTVYSEKSTLLFPYFVQWFTDGFLRTDATNRLKNTSNHHIDLSPVYGLNSSKTDLLRSFTGGRLKSQIINGEEYPPYLYDYHPGNPDSVTFKPEFAGLFTPLRDEERLVPATARAKLFAMGVERANGQVGYVMMNTLCLREHNRLAGKLADENPDWDDERLFQTARNILMVIIMRVVIEEYINHISPYQFKFRVDPQAFTDVRWYRQNWMTVEFTLVYRWHSMLPPTVTHHGQPVPIKETMWTTTLLTDRGLGVMFEETSRQPAGRLGLHNTDDVLVGTAKMESAEWRGIQLGRDAMVASYNDYREMAKFPRVTSFAQITGDVETQRELKKLYHKVDCIELYTGLYAEDLRANSPLSPLVGRLIAIDAFSQAFTNPLLAPSIFKKGTFCDVTKKPCPDYGWKIVNERVTLSDLVNRNTPPRSKPWTVTFYRKEA